jgi:tRNA-dihydrouridine synthase B
MKIANLDVSNPVLLAPISGYTDSALRQLCKEFGAGIVYTEFISSEGIIRDSKKTHNYLRFESLERPIGIQLFGHNPASMAEAARLVEDHYQPNIIDLNFGCSVRKVVLKNAGAAVLKDLDLLKQIATGVVKAVQIPVTAKIRAGWNRQSIVASEAAKILETAGIQALTIHPRTASDNYNHPARWELIAEIKQTLTIPVIGNGDIKTAADAIRMFQTTGCDAVMIGRAAIGNPWIFRQVQELLTGLEIITKLSLPEQIAMCLRHIRLEQRYYPDKQVNKIMRKFYHAYIREFPNASEIRNRLVRCDTLTDTIDILESIKISAYKCL